MRCAVRVVVCSYIAFALGCGAPPVPTPAEGGTDDSGSDASDATVAFDGSDGSDGSDSAFVHDGAADTAVESGRDSGSEAGNEGGCAAGELSCDGGCVPNDPQNCGTCGHDCTKLPNVSGQVACGGGGLCEFDAGACAPGYAHCGSGGPEQGCETPITTTSNCGACGVACKAGTPDCAGSGGTYACSSGCSPGMSLCSMTCTDTTTDRNNCGACGTMCTTQVGHATPSCAQSMCGYTCNGGYTPCNSGCADYQTDKANCGSCGNACTGGKQCTNGGCACPTGELDCNGTCESPGPQNGCGAGGVCGGACSGPTAGTGSATCNGTSCAISCASPTPDPCGTACVDTQSDKNNCGGCNKPCTTPMGATCSGGQCGCSGGEQNCGGTCTDVSSDAKNCGSCTHSCLGGTCSGGTCQPFVIAQPPATNTVGAVVTDGTNVVWLDLGAGKLQQIAATGGSVTTLDTGTTTSTTGWPMNLLSLGGGKLLYYGSEHGGGLAVATVGSASSGTYVGSLYGTWAVLNPAGTRWEADQSVTTPKPGVVDCAIGSSCVSQYLTSEPSAGLMDSTYAFASMSTQIFREPIGGGTWTSIVTQTNNLAQLASDGTYLYWNAVTMVVGPNQVVGNVYRTPEANPGTPALVVSGVSVFATDGANVYLPDGTAAHMQSVPAGGGSASTMFPISGCSRIAVAGKLLVWLSGTATINGAVLP